MTSQQIFASATLSRNDYRRTATTENLRARLPRAEENSALLVACYEMDSDTLLVRKMVQTKDNPRALVSQRRLEELGRGKGVEIMGF